LRDDEEKTRKAAGVATDKGKDPDQNTEGAALLVDDSIPGERVIVYDLDNPCMNLGSIYPDMKQFRLAIRQFAINKEFELQFTLRRLTQLGLLAIAWKRAALGT
jgi:hypothetical protein